MAQRIKAAESSTREELIELGRGDAECSDCDLLPPIFPTTEPPSRIHPPSNTVAVVVKISVEGGRIKIFEVPSNKYVGGVGKEDAGHIVIVPWRSSWWYYCIGALEVRYLVRKLST